MNGTLLDLFGVIAASTGLLGATVSGVLAFLLHRAAGDAERKHAERIRLELERLEGEELQSAVLLALADRVTAYMPGAPDSDALTQALRAYSDHLAETRHTRNELLSRYTVK